MQEEIMSCLLTIWRQNKELRFWQFLEYIKTIYDLPDDCFYINDIEFLNRLKNNEYK